ncbi:hypothetical protein [Ralstonia phage phiITL-1]|uniref:Uncharacterized protein n=1 Tax=Ralstonia phage phiITL-1 TaxID=1597967 RepID=A0A0U1ZDN1_9CAUD|nr:hypothetical protein HOR02_gp14 [Ralstonia phage phiITL-1]AJT60839.1 hypothetical protein [Ralstonia phage phiITL-1]
MAYNGHKNWSQWNVSLWINNDEQLYRQAQQCLRASRTKDQAAAKFHEMLTAYGVTETPDGAKYTKTSIRAALVGM